MMTALDYYNYQHDMAERAQDDYEAWMISHELLCGQYQLFILWLLCAYPTVMCHVTTSDHNDYEGMPY